MGDRPGCDNDYDYHYYYTAVAEATTSATAAAATTASTPFMFNSTIFCSYHIFIVKLLALLAKDILQLNDLPDPKPIV